MMSSEPKTLTVVVSDAEIRRHAHGTVRQLRDSRHRELRFRYSTTDRTKGAWHVVVGVSGAKPVIIPASMPN